MRLRICYIEFNIVQMILQWRKLINNIIQTVRYQDVVTSSKFMSLSCMHVCMYEVQIYLRTLQILHVHDLFSTNPPPWAFKLSTLCVVFLPHILFFSISRKLLCHSRYQCNSTSFPSFYKSNLPPNESGIQIIQDYGRHFVCRFLSYAKEFHRQLVKSYLNQLQSSYSQATIGAPEDCLLFNSWPCGLIDAV